MKNTGPMMRIHLFLMSVMCLGTAAGAVIFVNRLGNAITERERFSNMANVLLMANILCMLISGILYLKKKYSKQAAAYYTCFLLLNLVVCGLTVFIDTVFYKLTLWMILISILNVFKIVVLFSLTFAKDLGKNRTWTRFAVLMLLDIVKLVCAVIHMSENGFDFSFAGYITAILASGTIGLAIRGKYEDKAARGK